MNIITNHLINFLTIEETVVIPVVQGDTGRVLQLTPEDWTIPDNCTARYYVAKPSGKGVYYDAQVSGNSVYLRLTAQALAESGEATCNVRIYKDDDVVSSFYIVLFVQSSPVDAIESTSETNVFDQALEDAAEAIAQASQEAAEYIAQGIDQTLTIEDKAAGAKATGDALAALRGTVAVPYSQTTWNKGDLCYYNGKLYECTSKIRTAEAWDASHWQEITAEDVLNMLMLSIAYPYNYSAITIYEVGNLCWYDHKLYKCIEATTSPTFDSTKWEVTTINAVVNRQLVFEDDGEGNISIAYS